jgi:Zn-dependent protease with chaperone function
MLMRSLIRIVLVAALAFAAGGTVRADEPPKKDWERLRDKPVDYAPFERRRAENQKLGTTPLTQALAGGYASKKEIGTYPVLLDPAVTKGLALEMQKLIQADKLSIKVPPIEFVVVDDLGLFAELQAAGQDSAVIQAALTRESSNFTAESTGGGAIVVGLSVLKSVKNYDELDFVLGHEASHIMYDHFTEDERKEKIGEIIAVAALIADLATRNSSAKTKDAVAWSTLGLIVANTFLGPAWDRAQEREADGLGFELMMELGRSEDGMTNVLERFEQRDKAVKEWLDILCGPDTAGEHFLKSLLGSVLGINIPDGGYDPTSPNCAVRRNIFASLLSTHPEAKERKQDLEKHRLKFYADRPKVPMVQIGDGNASVLEFLSPNGDANRLVQAYDGIAAFHRGDLATARRLVQVLGSRGDQETQLPVLELQFYIANADGKRNDALHFLEIATKAPQTTIRFSRMAEDEYARDKRWADAARIVQRRMTLDLAPREEVLPLYIHYLQLAGKLADLEHALADCKAMNNPGMTLACEAMAHPPKPEEADKADKPATPPDQPPSAAPKAP